MIDGHYFFGWIVGMIMGACMMLCIAENEEVLIVTARYEDLDCIEAQVFGDDDVQLYCKKRSEE